MWGGGGVIVDVDRPEGAELPGKQACRLLCIHLHKDDAAGSGGGVYCTHTLPFITRHCGVADKLPLLETFSGSLQEIQHTSCCCCRFDGLML